MALLAGFVLRERTAAEPMVPLRLFRSRTFSAANAAAFLHSGAIFSAAFLTTEYFQRAGLRAAGHRTAAAALDRDAHDRRVAGHRRAEIVDQLADGRGG